MLEVGIDSKVSVHTHTHAHTRARSRAPDGAQDVCDTEIDVNKPFYSVVDTNLFAKPFTLYKSIN